MLTKINNLFSDKRLLSNEVSYLTSSNNFSKSIFDELKKYLIKKEIEFDNISTKKKKMILKKLPIILLLLI